MERLRASSPHAGEKSRRIAVWVAQDGSTTREDADYAGLSRPTGLGTALAGVDAPHP